jgi:hypothetical protein
MEQLIPAVAVEVEVVHLQQVDKVVKVLLF